jgi:hypothetical protein
MRPKFFLPFLFVLIVKPSFSQDYPDLIVTNENDSIICKITLVNEYNIFYQYNPKKKIISSSSIPRSSVIFFTSSETAVPVMEEKKYVEPEPAKEIRFNFKEEGGLIYSEKYTKAPVYGKGLIDMYDYIETNTRVYPADERALGGLTYVVLFALTIDSLGTIQNVHLQEPVSSTYSGYEAQKLEAELKRILLQMTPWTPAFIGEKTTESIVYLPLKFYLEASQIHLLPSQFSFSFNGRD